MTLACSIRTRISFSGSSVSLYQHPKYLNAIARSNCSPSSVSCGWLSMFDSLSEILFEKYGVPLEIARLMCNNYLRAFRQCPDNPAMDLDTWRHLLWTQALGEEYSALAGKIYLKWLQLRYHYLSLSPEVIALLNNLRQNYMLGLITNGPSAAQWEKIDKLKLKTLFDIILVSGDLPWEKPQHEIFDEACDYLGVKPGQCIMIGDKLETDILGGIQAKLGGTVWVPINSNAQCNGLKPDFIIESVTDLMDILPKNPKVPACRRKKNVISRLMESSPDLDDCNSNSSDGS